MFEDKRVRFYRLLLLQRQKIRQQPMPVPGQYRFGMKLYAHHLQVCVLDAHYLIRQAVFGIRQGRNRQAIG